ncbi:MAG TPA: hypothetical protein VFQ65_19465 [Kofleriaceae bacterium]|nr:hypothetical protein [Kofleriaceae bacterium]
MNKPAVLAMLVLLSARAFADPAPAAPVSPYGTSPFVVAYQPPPEVERAHHGLTLEVALGAGSTSRDASSAAVTFALGLWIQHDFALAFRVTQTGSYGFVGASVQYSCTPSLWLGAGLGNLSERTYDADGYSMRANGAGGFVRAGYNLAASGPHALYVAGELQAGTIDGETREVALLALGYQLL